MDKIRVYNPRKYDIGLVLQSGMERVIHPGSFTPMARDDTLGGIYEKRLQNGEYEIIHLFNNTQDEKSFDLEKCIVAFGGYGELRDGKAVVPKESMAYFVVK